MTSTDVYGYIDITRPSLDVYEAIDRWCTMGVVGIFFDRFGYDFGVPRQKQNCLVDYVHYKSLKSFVNAWDPDHVFGTIADPLYNAQGLECNVGANDTYLAESYQIVNGSYQDPIFWKTKSDKMQTYKTVFGTKMACITTNDGSIYDQNKWDYAYYSAALYNFDAAGWGEQSFSSGDSLLPFRPRKQINGTEFSTPLTETSPGVFSRDTNVGVTVDTVNHTTDTIV
jgi:hypothetical protein